VLGPMAVLNAYGAEEAIRWHKRWKESEQGDYVEQRGTRRPAPLAT